MFDVFFLFLFGCLCFLWEGAGSSGWVSSLTGVGVGGGKTLWIFWGLSDHDGVYVSRVVLLLLMC